MFSEETIKAWLNHALAFKKWFVAVPVPCIVEACLHPCSVYNKSTRTETLTASFFHQAELFDCFFNN